MISQADATLSAATTTTPATSNLHLLHHHHHQQQQILLHQQQEPQQLNHHIPTTTTTHHGKGTKTFSTKKRKKFEETIVDGFAIIAFRTWEDLQDELNSNAPTTIDTTNNSTADNSKKTEIINSKTHSTSSSSSSIASSASSTANHSDNHIATSGNKKKDKKKSKDSQFKNHSSSQKDKQRNKSSSEKSSLRKALEAKKLAEKRLSILQEKLIQEKNKNKSNSNNSVNINTITPNTTTNINTSNNTNNSYNNQQAESSISNTNINNQLHQHNVASQQHNQQPLPPPPQHHQQPQQQQHIKQSVLHNQDVHFSSNSHGLSSTHQIIKEEMQHSQVRSNGLLPSDMISDQNLTNAKSSQFPSFLPIGHPPRPYSTNIHQMPVYNPPQSPLTLPHLNQATQAPKHIQNQHSSTSLPSHPLMSQHQSTPPPQVPLVQQLGPSQQIHPQYSRPPLPSLLPQPMPYPQAQQSSMLSMSLNTLPSPYSCPPSIYITDTFSRQTSIIPPQGPPPPVLGSVLDPASAASQAARYGHSNVMHPITPYNHVVTPHHPMYYPTLPTERSFLEFARTYTGPGHIGYPNLMSSFPTSSSANPYRFDRWPRAILDQQRATNRYSSLYQGSTPLPDRAYSSYSTPRPPSFPASLFPPPF